MNDDLKKREEDEFEEDEDTQKDKFLTFKIEEEIFAIEIKNVVEIIKIQPITEIPETKDYIKGVINLRGKIIPVIDVRLRFKKKEQEYDDRTCIIVVFLDEIVMGLIVDRVSEVLTIPENKIEMMSFSSNSEQNRYIKGLGKTDDSVKIILDTEKLIKEEELKELKDLSNNYGE